MVLPLMGVQIVFRDSLPKSHFLKVQIFFYAPEDFIIDGARFTQLKHHCPFCFNQFRCHIESLCSMLNRSVMISVEVRAKLSVAVSILIFQTINKSLRVGPLFPSRRQKSEGG